MSRSYRFSSIEGDTCELQKYFKQHHNHLSVSKIVLIYICIVLPGLVDLSDNRFIGLLPSCLNTADNRVVKISGNCFSIDSRNQHPAAYCKEMDKRKTKSTVKEIALLVGVIGGIVIIVLTLLAAGLLFFCKRQHKQGTEVQRSPAKVVQDDPPSGISPELLVNASKSSRR